MEKKRSFGKRVTKVCMTMAAVLVCFYVMTITSHAYTQTSGTVIPATAKIRAEANTSSAVVGSTAAGKTVSITDEISGADGSVWYQVFVDAATKGYIRSDLVTKAGGAAPAPTPAPATPAPAAPAVETPAAVPAAAPATVTKTEWQSGKISSKSVRVRKDASTTADLVATVGRGTTITVTGKANAADGKEWFQVSFAYNDATITGFIRSDLITFGELPAETEDAEVTEITGTKSEETGKSADTSGSTEEESTATEPQTEPEAEPETEPQPEAQPQPETPVTTVTVLNAEEEPPLAPGFKEVAVTLNDEKVKAWKNGDFYIFYGQSAAGETGFYMYDSIETTYQRYYMSNVENVEKQGGLSEDVMKIILIVLGILVVVLLVVVTLLTMKVNNYRFESDWDEDDDDEDDDDDDDDDEDDTFVPLPKRVKKQPPVREEPRRQPQPEEPRRRPAGPSGEQRRPTGSGGEQRRPTGSGGEQRRPTGSGGGQRRPSAPSGESGNRPRNFLAEEEIEGRRAATKTGRDKKYAPSADLDPDDEDTFVFINLDGEQID